VASVPTGFALGQRVLQSHRGDCAKGRTGMKRRELAKALLEQIDRTRTQLARLRKVVMMKLSAKKTKANE